MRYVRYIGPAHVREISARDWRSIGIDAPSVQWGGFNGWAVPLDTLTEDQIRKGIEHDPQFVITGDGADFDPETVRTDNPLTTAENAEGNRVDVLDAESRENVFTTESDASADRSTPRNTTGGGTPADEDV